MLSQVLKAGKARSWSFVRLFWRSTGQGGEVFGRLKVVMVRVWGSCGGGDDDVE